MSLEVSDSGKSFVIRMSGPETYLRIWWTLKHVQLRRMNLTVNLQVIDKSVRFNCLIGEEP